MRILVILSRVPYPLEKGDKLRAFHHLKQLHTKHELIVCCLTDQPVHPRAQEMLKDCCTHLYIFTLSKSFIYWSLFKGIWSKKPFQVNYFYQEPIRLKIQQVVEKHTPKHIYAQLIRVSEYVKDYKHLGKTIDYMDCFSVGMKRRIKHSSWFMKPLVWIESKRLAWYEKDIFPHFDHHLIISAQDRDFIQHPKKDQMTVLPNGIDTDYFDKKHTQDIPKTFDILFTGNMSYLPNVEAAKFLVQKIVPKLLKQNPAIKILICGADPSPAVKSLASNNVEVRGWVDDIRLAYASCKIFVAPLFLGSGLQNKLLEAMRMGLPCITTPMAANSLNAIAGHDIEVADTPEAFVAHIQHLLSNHLHFKQISEEASVFVKSNFSWQKSVDQLEKLFFENT